MNEVNEELESLSQTFIENVDVLEELSRKVSREGMRRIFLATTRFPYVGTEFKVTNVHESELLKQSLYIKELATKISELMPKEEIKDEVVGNVADAVLTALDRGEKDGGKEKVD